MANMAFGNMGSGMAYCMVCASWYNAASRTPHMCTANPFRPMSEEDRRERDSFFKLRGQVEAARYKFNGGSGKW